MEKKLVRKYAPTLPANQDKTKLVTTAFVGEVLVCDALLISLLYIDLETGLAFVS